MLDPEVCSPASTYTMPFSLIYEEGRSSGTLVHTIIESRRPARIQSPRYGVYSENNTKYSTVATICRYNNNICTIDYALNRPLYFLAKK